MFKKGDLVECLEDYYPGTQFTKGKIYEVSQGDHYFGGHIFVEVVADDSGIVNGRGADKFRLFAPAAPNILTTNYSYNLTGAHTVSTSSSIPHPKFEDAYMDLVEKLEAELKQQELKWKKEGLCPKCGEKGYFSHFAFVCSTHGEY